MHFALCQLCILLPFSCSSVLLLSWCYGIQYTLSLLISGHFSRIVTRKEPNLRCIIIYLLIDTISLQLSDFQLSLPLPSTSESSLLFPALNRVFYSQVHKSLKYEYCVSLRLRMNDEVVVYSTIQETVL